MKNRSPFSTFLNFPPPSSKTFIFLPSPGEPVLDWRVIQLPLDDLSRLLKLKVPAEKAAGRQRTATAAPTTTTSPPLKASAHSGAAAAPLKSPAALAAAAAAAAGGMRAPTIYRGTLVVPAPAATKTKGATAAAGEEQEETVITTSSRDSQGFPASTWADLSGWGKGLLYVNGVNLGYYWPSKGPQTRQYVPGPVLKTGNNEIVLVELEAKGPGTLSFASEPDFRCRVMPSAGTMM